MPVYIVTMVSKSYELVEVDAESEEEAIELASEGAGTYTGESYSFPMKPKYWSAELSKEEE